MSLDENKQPEVQQETPIDAFKAPIEDPYGTFGQPMEREESDRKSTTSFHILIGSICAMLAALLVLAVLLIVLPLIAPKKPVENAGTTSSTVTTTGTSVTVINKTTTTTTAPGVTQPSGGNVQSTTVPVQQIAITNESGSYTIVYNAAEKLYQLKGYEDLLLEPDGTSALSGSLATLNAINQLEKQDDLSIVGLDKPASTVTATYADGSTVTLYVGKEVASGDAYYVSLQGSDEVYICASDKVLSFLASATDYVETTLITQPTVNTGDQNGAPCLQEVTLSGKNFKKPLTVRRRVNADKEDLTYYTYIISDPYLRGVSDEAANELVTFYQLEASQAVVLHPTDAQLEEYGFKDPLLTMDLTVSVVSTSQSSDGLSEEVLQFYNAATAKLTVGDKDADGNYLVMIDGVNAIFLVTADQLSMVAERTYDNTVTDLLFLKNITEVGKVTITVNGEVHNFTLTHHKNVDQSDRDKMLTVSEGATIHSTAEFRDLYQLMMGIERYDGLETEPTVAPTLGIAIYDTDGTLYISANFYPATGSRYHVRTSEGETFVTLSQNITHFIKQVDNLLKGEDVLIITQ